MSDNDAKTFQSDPAELKWFVAAVRAGLEGRPDQMQQFLRRSLKRLPPGVRQDSALMQALFEVATQTSTPVAGSARERSRDLTASPTRLAGQYFDGYPSTTETDAPSTIDIDELPTALTDDRGNPTAPILNPSSRSALDNLIAGHLNDLRQWGVQPVGKVLLTGPPGTGKTMAARWVAHEMRLPLLVLNLADVMSHELGKSAKNLSEAMRYCSEHRVVLLVDEFDAVASARADSTDVGEVRRLVNVLLMALDTWPPSSLLVAATNHPELLDRAVERRFDEHLALDLPNAEAARKIWRRELPALTAGESEVLAQLSTGQSGAGIVRAAQQAKRAGALRGCPPEFSDALDVVQAAYLGLEHQAKKQRDRLIQLLAQHTDLTRRAIADILNVSHTTVNTVVKQLLTND